VVAVLPTTDASEVLVTTQHGITIRMAVKGIRSQARNTLGVRVIRLDEGDTVRDAVILEPPIEGNGAEGAGGKAAPPGPGPEAPEPPAEEESEEDGAEDEEEGGDEGPPDEESDDRSEDDDASSSQAR
jgi:DNA gyrase subunit A